MTVKTKSDFDKIIKEYVKIGIKKKEEKEHKDLDEKIK